MGGRPEVKVERLATLSVQRINQATKTTLCDLFSKLVAVVLNKPDVLDVNVVDFPAFRGFFHTVINRYRRPVALVEERTYHYIVRFGIASERTNADASTLIHTGSRTPVGTYQVYVSG